MIDMGLAVLAGVGIGWILCHFFVVRSLLGGYARLRYDGFRPEAPPQRPKMVPQPPIDYPRED